MSWLNKLFAPFSGLTDEQAMGRVQQHDDPDAFALLVCRWQRPIQDLCIRMTGDSPGGEDLAQETFTRVFASRHRYETGRKFSTWLWRIAINLCHDQRRRAIRRGETPLDEDSEGEAALQALGPNPAEETIQKERTELVQQALASLPEIHRTVLVLREYQGLKLREIAEVLDIPEGTVKSRLADALTYLQRHLKPLLKDETLPNARTQPRERALV
jgi:RNA polymerase sigma-70 factor, ECF subfamily